MSDETNGQAITPAGGQVAEEEPEDFVTLSEADGVEDDGEGTEEEGDEAAEGSEHEGKPKRKPGSARQKERIRALEREVDDLRKGQVRRAPAEDDDLKEPNESDFPNDYLAFDRALRAFQTRKAIREERARDDKADEAVRADTEHRTRLAGYNVRLEGVKDRIPDFNKVMASASDMEVRDGVRDLILESPKGPLLAYHLAKNPEKVAALNRMSPTQAAREIGSLEARIRGPQPKSVTKAKEPVRALKGGGGAPAETNPDKMSNEQYRDWRAKQK